MDPEVAAALVAGLLALIGLRRRGDDARTEPTLGQQVARRGEAVAGVGAGLVRKAGSTAASLSVGTTEVALLSAAVAARTLAGLSTEVAARSVGLLGRATSGVGGLVVDGAAAVLSGAGSVVARAGRPGRPAQS